MRARNVIALVCILILLSVGVGTAYASYTSTLTDDETMTVTNNYGTTTMSESEGVYTLRYVDTTADSVYLTMRISGLSSDFAPGTVVDLWLGKQDVLAEFGSTYNATVSNGELTALSRPLSHTNSTYSDGDTDFTVTCTAGTISVSVGGSPITVTFGNFRYHNVFYIVDAAGDTINGVSRIIPVNGSSGAYHFDDGGYRYALTCSGSSVTSANRCVIVSSTVDAMGVAEFGTWTKELTQKSWQDTVDLYCGGSRANLGLYTIEARFYSAEVV